ncbi:MAG: hypothetical protein P4N41_03705 [Negativicutes bacterium]|nr:hypothetical protein [Negativicutes bacterium]
MKNSIRLVILLVVCLFLLEGAALAMEFSADVISTSGGKTVSSGKMWFSNDRMRLETQPSELKGKDQPQAVVITRLDKLVVWILMAKEQKYLEQSFSGMIPVVSESVGNVQVDRQLLGSEVIDGRTANKYRVTTTVKGKSTVTYQWLGADSGIPLKFSDEKGQFIQEYRNLVVGPQDPSLFEVPAGYQKMSIPSFGNLFS